MNHKTLLKQILLLTMFFSLVLPLEASVEALSLQQQIAGKKISGRVIDKTDNMSLIGVSVQIKGTTKGTITDLDGNYTLEVTEGDKTLVFSYIGMKTTEIEIGDQTEINISMESDAYGLDEVVISGVASATPKKKLTVSVVSVNGEELKEAHSSSAASALQSKVAGLQVIHANGLPGSGASIRLRGSTSLTGNQSPLIILDGSIIETSLSDINLDDIESFEVVKGAAAAALYGSKAGNGVIVLISKRGKKLDKGATKVTFRTEMGFQELSKKLDLSTHHPYVLAEDWSDYPYTRYDGVFYYNDIKISGSRKVTENAFADQEFANLYDNQDLFFKNGLYHTEYIGISGNEEKTNFLISFENNKQEGIVFATDGYQRNNIKVNLDRFISDKLKISTSNLIIKTKANNPGSYKTFQDVLFMSPDIDLTAKNSDSTDYKILPDDWGIAENPLYPLVNIKKESKRFSLIGNVRLNYFITDWLKADAKYTYEVRDKNWTTLTPKGYLATNGQNIGGKLYKSNYDEFNNNAQITLNANKQFNDFTTKLKLSYLYENKSYSSLTVTGRDFIFEGVPHLNNTDPEKTSLNSYNGNIVSINYFGITDFDYKDKYLFSALYRIDGSSLFGENVRWNPYYRLSGAYRLSEDFTLPGIDEFKFRAAIGTSGQRPGYSYQYETWNISGGKATKNSVGNKDLKPSTTKEIEFGFYVDFLKRFSLEAIYSNSVTENVIAKAPLPSHYGGYAYKWQNLGSIGGSSIEFNLKMNIIKQKDFNWNSNLIFDRIRQHIIKLDIPDYKTGPKNAFSIQEGEIFGVMYGYKWVTTLDQMSKQLPEGKSLNDYEVNSDGYVVPTESQGTVNEIPINIDENNDGLPDKIQIGDGNANFNLSLGNTINYHGLNLYFLFAWKNGGDVYNYTKQYSFRDLRAIEFDQSGKAEEDKKTINYYSTFYKNTEINSYFIENGSFIKLRELALSYSLNKKILNSVFGGFVKGFKIGVEARNIFTITDYSGYDPEVASGDDLSNYPFDNFGYPNFRTYSASLKLTF